MASGTIPSPPQKGPPPPPPRQPDPYEALIDQRVRHTQRQVKGADIAAGLLTLAVGGLAYLFVAALIDHWIVPGGLGFAGRMVLFLILAATSAAYFVWRVLPLLIHRINPLFAAYTIEQSRPSLKNSLINLLFLRGQRAQLERDVLSQRIYQGLERNAAADLSRVSADAAVDHSQIIRQGYVLAGLVAIAAIYLALSPKNPLTSFGRVILPWAGIRAPTRVMIDRVEPGDSVVYQGDYVTLSAEVRGLDDDEPVLLYYTTADGQSVDQAIPMTVSEGEYRHRCQLPPGPLGMQQETVYYLKAGDCTTRPFRLEVQPALSIRVDSVNYHYPEYTGLSDRSVERQGDVRAIEGTQITVRATASHPIQQATIEMDCKPQFGLRMTASGTAATGQFTLAMSRENAGRPEHDSYQVRFRDAEGREDRRPTRYRIEVIPDLPPDVHLIEPPADGSQFPVDGVLPLRVRAEDPDFALRSVALRLEVDGKGLPVRPMLNKLRPDKPHQGSFEAVYRFQPAKMGLKAGDKVVYLAEAVDNKEPVGNRSKTQARTLVLAPPQTEKSSQERSAQGEKGASPSGKQAKEGDRSKQSGQAEQDQKNEMGQEPDKSPDKQPDPRAKPGQEQAGQPRPKDDSSPPPEAENQEQPKKQSQADQQGGTQNQEGQSGQGDSSSSRDGKGQSGKSPGKQDSKQETSSEKQDPSSSQESGQKGQGDPSQSGNNQENSRDGSSSPTGSQGAGQKGDAQNDKPSEQRQQPVDGNSNPGDVFEKALERRAEQEKAEGGKGKGEGNRKQQNPDGTQQGDDNKQPNAESKPENAEGKQQGADGKQQGTDAKQEGADGKQQGADSKQQGMDGKQQGADGKQQGTDSKQQGADGKQPNADGKQQGADGKQQGADGKQQGAEGKQQEVADGKQQGMDGKQPGADGKQQGTDSKQQGADGKQPNADGKQQGADGKEQGADGKQQGADGKEQATEGKPNGGEPGAKGGDRQAKEGQSQQPQGDESKPGDSPRGQAQRMPDNEGAGKKSDSAKPEAGEGMQSKGAGQPDKDQMNQQKSPATESGQRPDQRGGDRESSSGSAGAGQPPQESQPTPSPQEANRERPKNAGPQDQKPSETQNPATSPSISHKTSDSQGDTGGDRSGGGEQGGGQAAKQSGAGTAGTHSAAEQGGARSEQQGEGETGTKGGDQMKADRPTGHSAKSEGPGSRQQADGKPQNAENKSDSAASGAEPGGQGSPQPQGGKTANAGGQAGAGNPTGGGMPGPQPDATNPPPAVQLPGDPYNREFAEKQTTLALEYLKDQLAKNKPDPKLLDQLGWNRQDLEKFVARWEAMRRAAAEPGPSGEVAKKQFDEALKSLGLQPRGTVLRGGETGRDRLRNLKEPGRFEPPPEWSEALRAYNRGVAGGKE